MQLVEAYPALAGMLSEVEARIERVRQEGEGFLGEAAGWALSGRGKRLRPSILLLAAECAGGATETSLALATAVELVHAASLVHDDVLDEASSRRGRPSANSLWGNKVSVLLGDYVIARALELLPESARGRVVPPLAGIAAEMCRGQVQELTAAGRPLGEQEYTDIAMAKTGKLFGFCGRAGVETAGGPEALAVAMERFGESFGVAFQFADDILDLVGTDGRSGKPEARDVHEHKFTLPLILAVEAGGRGTARRLTAALATEDMSEESLRRVRGLVEAQGAVALAWERVKEWLGAARDELTSAPPGDARTALLSACGDRFPMPIMAAET